MASLYIAEFPGFAPVGRGAGIVPLLAMPPIKEQVLAVGVTSVPSAALDAGTNVIRVVTDTTCSIAITGPKQQNGTVAATAANARIAANAPPELFVVQPGSIVSVISNS